MAYQTTMTKKGQITIPKKVRDSLGLREGRRLTVEFKEGDTKITVKAPQDFLEVALTVNTKRKEDPIKARAQLEKRYERA